MESLRICIAIPCFNEGARLPPFLTSLVAQATSVSSPPVEWIVVDDGSSASDADREAAAVAEATEQLQRNGSPHRVRFVRSPKNGGKGNAIRLGWQHASPSAEWLGFLDADGAISPSEFFRVAQLLPSLPADFVAGSRVKMAGRRIERRLFRHLQGRVFATLVSLNFGLDFYDTQCGLKFIRANRLRPLLPRLVENRWMLDLELILRLRQNGATFHEVPIDWSDTADSRVRFGVDALRMYWAMRRMKKQISQ